MAASDVAFLAPLDSDSRGTLFRDIARRRKIEYPDASMVNDKSILGKSSQTFRENFSSRIRSIIYRYAKRLFDITFSAFILVVALVPGLILATAIAIETKAWPIYSQERIGKGGHPFRIYKFRTMVSDSHNIEKYFTSEQMDAWRRERKVVDDPRITPLGRVLRSTSVDELPNFINVLKGEIPLRIIKTGQGEPCEISGLFALPAKELRTQKALFPQVKVASGTCLRTVQNFFSNHTAQRAQTQRILTKRKFTHISWGGASVALPSASRGCLAMAPHLGW